MAHIWVALVIVQGVMSPVSNRTGGPLHLSMGPNPPTQSNIVLDVGKLPTPKGPMLTLNGSDSVQPEKKKAPESDTFSDGMGIAGMDTMPDTVQSIGRMTGVEADVYVYNPTVTTLSFPSKELCEKAAGTLAEQSGVLSASCVQTQ
jgi:hypothetical protein